MPAPSKIKQLKPEERAMIDAFLTRENPSVDDFWAFLTEDMALEIGRSSAHRYQQDFEKVATRLRESRQMTEALARELGEASSQGKQGRLLVEMARTLVFDMMVKLQESDDDELDPKDVAFLGKGLAELGRALRSDQDFEIKVQEQARKKALEDAADKIDTLGQEAGMSKETRDEWRRGVLGIDDAS